MNPPNHLKKISSWINRLKNIPFETAIESLYGFKAFKFNLDNKYYSNILNSIAKSMVHTCHITQKNPISSQRINEVGNLIEKPSLKTLKDNELPAEIPSTISGNKKSVGYPDIVISLNPHPIYLEIKTYKKQTINSHLRTFYMSPSINPKITKDGYHLLVGFEIEKNKRGYIAQNFQLIDLYGVKVSLKAEINTSNANLYQSNKLLINGNALNYEIKKK